MHDKLAGIFVPWTHCKLSGYLLSFE